jgi:hypothetical protein
MNDLEPDSTQTTQKRDPVSAAKLTATADAL